MSYIYAFILYVHYHSGSSLFSRNRGIPKPIPDLVPNSGPIPDHFWHFGPNPEFRTFLVPLDKFTCTIVEVPNVGLVNLMTWTIQIDYKIISKHSSLTFKARQCSTLSFPGSVISENEIMQWEVIYPQIIGKVFLLAFSAPLFLSSLLPHCDDKETIDVWL